MNELIKINYETEQPTVSARDLHEKLNIGTKFTTWFERMKEYGFSEGNEFFPKVGETPEKGGRPSVDYSISVDMAKQICMIQRTPEGRECRQYFIDLEKAWNTPEQVMARALKMANQSIESLKERCKFLGDRIVGQQKVIEEMQPKATYYDLILQCPDLVSATEIAKDYGMSATKLNRILHDYGIQFKQSGIWFPYQEYAGFGYTKTKTHNYSDADGVQHSKQHMYWTQKGRLFLYDFLKEKEIVPLIEHESVA